MRKVVIVTGASRGLGREVALKFGQAGWGVTINYHSSKERAEGAAQEILKAGSDAFAYQADVRDIRQVETMIAETMARWGRIDVLVNNAGTGVGGLMAKLSDDLWDDVIDTNLKGAFNCIKVVSKYFIKQRTGHIINIGSITGLRGKAGHAAYSSSKAGLIGLTKAIAVELAPRGIQVNAVLPGYVLTDMGEAASDKAKEEALNNNLLKRYSDPTEVAEFIFHLAGMKAVSGQVFNLDSRVI